MNIKSKEFVELIGTISIVASLIFVGLQLRLEARLATAEIYAQRAEHRLITLQTLLESEVALRELANLRESQQNNFIIPSSWIVQNDPLLTEARRLRHEMLFVSFDNVFYQASLGLIEDSSQSLRTFERVFPDDETLDYLLTSTGSLSQATRSYIQSLKD